jgi:rSAM/selenodomain-associated transferase 1
MRCALVIVGKAPRAGRTKTRLVPPLTAAEAAELSAAFLLDTIDTALSLGWERVSLIHPATRGEAELLCGLVADRVHLCAQSGSGLGDALRGAFVDHFGRGFERVVLVDSDSPTLPRHMLQDACAALDRHDVTIGPSVDGGYYLLGLRKRRDRLFEGIAWSTSYVYQQTLDRARGLRVQALPEWYDVDVAADLARLHADLARQPADVAPHTRRALGRLLLEARR